MHVPDGFLNAPTSLATGAIAAGAVGLSLQRANREIRETGPALAGLTAAFVFAVQMVNFLFLLAILYRFLYKPLLAKMEERTVAIKQSLEAAEAARAEAARQQEENAARLRAAYTEAQAIRAAARFSYLLFLLRALPESFFLGKFALFAGNDRQLR